MLIRVVQEDEINRGKQGVKYETICHGERHRARYAAGKSSQYRGSVNRKDVVPIPIMTFLIDHPEGLVLYDTGFSERSPVMADSKDELVFNRLSQIGVRPRDIRYVVCSHLQIDHAGGLEYFPQSEIIVSDAELTNVARLYFLESTGPPFFKAMFRPGYKPVEVEIGGRGGEDRAVPGWRSSAEFRFRPFFGMLGVLLELPKTGQCNTYLRCHLLHGKPASGEVAGCD